MLSKYDRAALHFGLESLETRRMLSGASVNSSHVLNITGSSGKDTITLTKLPTGGKLEVNINGTKTQFSFGTTSGKYQTIVVKAGGNNDTVTINNNVQYKSSQIMGEAGNDKLTGGLGPDLIQGGSGQDQANYSQRTDNLKITLDNQANDGANGGTEGDNVQTEEVYTGSGNDIIIGSDGPDGIFSGAGADQVDGKGGNDIINGSSGSDILLGGANDDSVDAENNDADQVNTGDGVDFLAFDPGLDTAAPDALAAQARARALFLQGGGSANPSDLDVDYGEGGKQHGPDLNLDDIAAVAVDSQGRVIFAGSVFTGHGYGGGDEDMIVTRYTADGQPDDSFGDGGSTIIDFSTGLGYGYSSNDNAYGVAIGSGDTIVVVGSANTGVGGSRFAIAQLTEGGDLDHSFSGDGKQTVSLNLDDSDPFDAVARDVAIQSDGKIVVVGDRNRINTEVSYDPAAEFSPDQNPGGVWSYAFSPTLDDSPTNYDTASQPGGLDYWSSSTLPTSQTLAPDVFHNGTGDSVNSIPDGQLNLDPGFYGQYSHVIFTAPTTGTYDVNGQFDGQVVGNGATTDVHVLVNGVSQFDGDINVPAGSEGSPTADFDLSGLSLNAGDTVDFTVGYGANQNFTDDTTALSAEITRTSAPDDQSLAVARLTDTGNLDSNFNFGQGFNTIDVGSDETATSVALQTFPDDFGAQRIVVGGSADGNFVVSRFLDDGEVDFGFGDFGGYSTQTFELGGQLKDIAVDADNNIYAVGTTLTDIFSTAAAPADAQPRFSPQDGTTSAVIAKFSDSGSFITSTEEPGFTDHQSFNGVTVDSSGRIVAVGNDDQNYIAGRYDSSLNFDTSFAPELSTVDVTPDGSEFSLTDVALGAGVLSDGKIVVGGSSFDSEFGTLFPSAIRFVGDQQTPFNAEKILSPDDLKDPPPDLVDALAPSSDSAKIYFLSAPDANGNVDIHTNSSATDVVTITKIKAADGTDNYAVTINGITQYYAVDTTNSISINTDGGPDIITADDSVKCDLLVFASDGDDKITGGGGRNFLFGQGGNDTVNGGSKGDVVSGGSGRDVVNGNNGNDIVLGGPNNDTCNGGSGEDIVIGGNTNYDGDLTALHALLDEWTSGHSNSTRISNLKNGTGLNAPFFLSVSGPDKTVFDDSAADQLTGGSNRDWFFYRKNGTNKDTVTDNLTGEEVSLV